MPIEIALVQSSPDTAILAFDGRILEIFHQTLRAALDLWE